MDEQVEPVRRLGLLASALAGQRMEVTTGERGSPSWTDGLTVYLDPELNAEQSVRAAAVQASLVAAGSLRPELAAQLRARGDLCPRYLVLEGQRALALLEDVLPDVVAPLLGCSPLTDSAAASLDLARSGVPLAAPPLVFGQIRPRLLRQPTAGLVTVRAGQAVREARSVREVDDAADLAEGSSAHDLSSRVGGGGAIGRLLQRLTSVGRSRDAGSPGADAATYLARRASVTGRGAAVVTSATRASDFSVLGSPAPQTYPEWDCHRSAYRESWCTVRLREPTLSSDPLVVDPSRPLRRALGRVMPDLSRVRRQLQGDDLDIDATVSERVDVMAGVTPDEAVYVDSLRRRRDLAVLILLDVSASAAEPSTRGGSVHEGQRCAAASLAVTLHELGDRVAVDAFRSMGRDNIEITRVKRFDEPADMTMLRRFAALVPGAYTRLGAAIRHGCATLELEAGTSRRLLIVVTDGFAYDHGYEGRYGEADAHRALAEARRSGIGCLCLSVGAITELTALKRVFGSAAHASLAGPDELPMVVASLFPAALRTADLRRRAWQHRSRSRQRQELDRRTA